jgi:hypothetical protein
MDRSSMKGWEQSSYRIPCLWTSDCIMIVFFFFWGSGIGLRLYSGYSIKIFSLWSISDKLQHLIFVFKTWIILFVWICRTKLYLIQTKWSFRGNLELLWDSCTPNIWKMLVGNRMHTWQWHALPVLTPYIFLCSMDQKHLSYFITVDIIVAHIYARACPHTHTHKYFYCPLH